MTMEQHVRKMRLENLEKQLDKMDFTTEEVDLEGVVFNMGKLILEHLNKSDG